MVMTLELTYLYLQTQLFVESVTCMHTNEENVITNINEATLVQ